MKGAAGANGNKATHTMKVLEEYAIECSIAKVFGSEVLDYTVDEAVQIYGGYGFHEDYPVARGYRDSRVNRIFEGTNEINRMLIIQMLMKRAVAGSLPLMAAGAKLQEEILSGAPVEDSSDGQWAEESRIVQGAKKVFLLAAGAALQKYRDRLADQQEIIGALSDIVLEIYPMESALLRAEKAAAARGKDSSGAIAAAARVLLQDGAARVEASARTALAASVEGDMLRTQLAVLRRMIKREPADTIGLRRTVAEAVINANSYPFEGR
jgi:butyryl-CoA dehydrogenase